MERLTEPPPLPDDLLDMKTLRWKQIPPRPASEKGREDLVPIYNTPHETVFWSYVLGTIYRTRDGTWYEGAVD